MSHDQIKGLPPGWRPVRFFQSILHPRDAVVMCSSATDATPEHQTRYVVWGCNMIEGGCHNGYYTDERSKARTDFHRRVENTN